MIKNIRLQILISVLVAGLFFAAAYAKPHTVFQFSVLNSLMAGVYDGELPVAELLKNGDFGVGTFDGLDGEMIIADGKTFQVRHDGIVIHRQDNPSIPFAQVCSFKPQDSFYLSNTASLESLKQIINTKLHSKNLICAIKIKGRFNHVKTRSVPMQSKPYRPLAEVLKNQSIFEFTNVEGQIIGFRQPEFIREINAPGYHFHFLNKDLTAGGHMLEVSIASAEVMLDRMYEYHLQFPNSKDFLNKDLSGDLQYKP